MTNVPEHTPSTQGKKYLHWSEAVAAGAGHVNILDWLDCWLGSVVMWLAYWTIGFGSFGIAERDLPSQSGPAGPAGPPQPIFGSHVCRREKNESELRTLHY